MSRCRSCQSEIRWARTERGKRIPLDPDPYQGPEPAGLFVLRPCNTTGGDPTPLAIAVPPGAFEDEPLYRSHFVTCPDAALHRRSRA